jgi:DNA-binding NarL/FixJ family response regulator
MIKTILADDHQLFTDGLERLLSDTKQFSILKKFTDPFSLLNEIPSLKPDLIVIDIEFGSISGLDLIPRIRSIDKEAKIVILSMHQENVFSQEAKVLGANGYFVKNVDHDVLIESLSRICTGDHIFPTSTKKTPTRDLLLSEREIQILKLLANGSTSEDIASQLRISGLTVKTHRKNMMQKLNASNGMELIKKAFERGLI